MVATYRYLLADLLTNSILLDLPFSGVSYDRRLNGPGNGTFSFQMNSFGATATEIANYNQMVIDSTIPGRTAVYIERNSALVWGGIIWSRLYESEGQTVQFTAQTFESFLYKQVVESTQAFTNVDQRNIFALMVQNMQAKFHANIGIVVPGTFANVVRRSTTFWDYEVWTYGKVAENLVGYADGFDYTIDVQYSSGVPVKQLLIDNVLGSPASVSGLAWDYPGGIKNYYYPENASNAATSVIGVGAGDGKAMLRSKAQTASLLTAGYPDLQEVYTNKDVSVASTLASQTRANLTQISVPIIAPTFEVNPEVGPGVNDFALGDYGYVNIDDPRFPSTTRVLVRVVGYQAKPPQSDGPEEFKLVLEGQDDTT
jgi:hypothetical protein